MLLQAYDFVHLNREYGCELQIGGSDQWGNVTAGIDLARRMRGVQLYGMTCPLLTKSDGSKMGKTESGAIWLSAERTSPYAFYQYWINVADEDAGMCLRFLTELDHEEIEALDESRASEPHKNESQKRLGGRNHATDSRHPRPCQGETGHRDFLWCGDCQPFRSTIWEQIFADVPSSNLSLDKLLDGDGWPVIDALVESGLAKSKGEARRAIKEGGIYVNNKRIPDVDTRLTQQRSCQSIHNCAPPRQKELRVLKFT